MKQRDKQLERVRVCIRQREIAELGRDLRCHNRASNVSYLLGYYIPTARAVSDLRFSSSCSKIIWLALDTMYVDNGKMPFINGIIDYL